MNATTIEWTDLSVNPIRARRLDGKQRVPGHFCQKISPGCANCYASRTQPRFGLPQFPGTNKSPTDMGVELFLDQKVLESVLRRRKPAKLFWFDMTDAFGDWVPFDWLDQCFAVMALTPHLTHQVLTKRPERMAEYLSARTDLEVRGTISNWSAIPKAAKAIGGERYDYWKAGIRWPLPNVWLGTSVENQEQADKRIPHLKRCPAAVLFLSVEPLLGPIDLTRWLREPLEVTYDGLDLRSLDAQVGEDRGQDGQDITLAGQLPSSDRLPALSNALVVPTDSSTERGGDPFDHRPIGRVDREANTVGIPRLAPPVEVSLAIEQTGDVGNRREISRDGHGRRQGARSGTSNRNAVRSEPSLNGRSTQADNSADLREGHTALVKAGDRVHSPNSTVPMIDWLIIGGESGHGARQCPTEWIKSIVDQSRAADTPCFVKQLGSKPVWVGALKFHPIKLKDSKGGDPVEWPAELRIRQMPFIAAPELAHAL